MRKFLKIGGIALAFVLLLVAIASSLVYAMMRHFYPSPPQAISNKPKDPLDAQRQDADYLAKLVAMDRSYSPTARVQAQQRLAALADANTVLPHAAFLVAMMEIAALADNGHTHVGSDDGADPMELPVRVAAFSDGIYVMHATTPYADLLGGKIVSIDDHPIDEVMARLEQLRGGTTQWRKVFAEVYISWQDVLEPVS
jgi:type II secretory pathway component PulK